MTGARQCRFVGKPTWQGETELFYPPSELIPPALGDFADSRRASAFYERIRPSRAIVRSDPIFSSNGYSLRRPW